MLSSKVLQGGKTARIAIYFCFIELHIMYTVLSFLLCTLTWTCASTSGTEVLCSPSWDMLTLPVLPLSNSEVLKKSP